MWNIVSPVYQPLYYTYVKLLKLSEIGPSTLVIQVIMKHDPFDVMYTVGRPTGRSLHCQVEHHVRDKKKSTFSKLHHKKKIKILSIYLHEYIYTISITYLTFITKFDDQFFL